MNVTYMKKLLNILVKILVFKEVEDAEEEKIEGLSIGFFLKKFLI